MKHHLETLQNFAPWKSAMNDGWLNPLSRLDERARNLRWRRRLSRVGRLGSLLRYLDLRGLLAEDRREQTQSQRKGQRRGYPPRELCPHSRIVESILHLYVLPLC